MKRLLLLVALSPLVLNAQTTIFEENFDSYTAGNYAGNESPYMTSWTETPGGADDCFISSAQASSPSNSIEIVGQSGPMDAIVQFPNSYDGSGEYKFSMKYYVPTGSAGYFNCQESTTPGLGWKCDVFFATDGSGYVSAEGIEIKNTFTYPKDAWFDVEVYANLSTDVGEVSINGTPTGTFMWSTGVAGDETFKRWGGINFYAYGPNDDPANYFVDDMKLEDVTDDASIGDYNLIELTVYPNPTQKEFSLNWESTEVYDLLITDIAGKTIYNEAKVSSNASYDLGLAAGTYFITLFNESDRVVKKVVIK